MDGVANALALGIAVGVAVPASPGFRAMHVKSVASQSKHGQVREWLLLYRCARSIWQKHRSSGVHSPAQSVAGQATSFLAIPGPCMAISAGKAWKASSLRPPLQFSPSGHRCCRKTLHDSWGVSRASTGVWPKTSVGLDVGHKHTRLGH